METHLQKLQQVLQVHNFVIAERHLPGDLQGYIHHYIRDVQQKKVIN